MPSMVATQPSEEESKIDKVAVMAIGAGYGMLKVLKGVGYVVCALTGVLRGLILIDGCGHIVWIHVAF